MPDPIILKKADVIAAEIAQLAVQAGWDWYGGKDESGCHVIRLEVSPDICRAFVIAALEAEPDEEAKATGEQTP